MTYSRSRRSCSTSTDPAGARLLYATDTGPLPSTALESIGGPFDVLLVDETFGETLDHGTGHLDLATLPRPARRLRGAVRSRMSTTVAATHLSHHNPPTSRLRDRLAGLGVQVLDDLSTSSIRPIPTGGEPVRHLVLGGARSGKSTFAERLATSHAAVTYVATGGQRPDDAEWTQRIGEHRARRPAHWTTIESIDVVGAIGAGRPGEVVLVDCLALWLTRPAGRDGRVVAHRCEHG